MDTKLKNRHKLAIFFIMITILIPSLAMMTGYFSWYQMRTETKTKAFKNAEKSSDFLGHFLESTYLLYNTESGRKYADDVEKSLYDSYNAEMSRYSHFNSYLDYRVLDENGGDIEKSTVLSISSPIFEKSQDKSDGAIFIFYILSYGFWYLYLQRPLCIGVHAQLS